MFFTFSHLLLSHLTTTQIKLSEKMSPKVHSRDGEARLSMTLILIKKQLAVG